MAPVHEQATSHQLVFLRHRALHTLQTPRHLTHVSPGRNELQAFNPNLPWLSTTDITLHHQSKVQDSSTGSTNAQHLLFILLLRSSNSLQRMSNSTHTDQQMAGCVWIVLGTSFESYAPLPVSLKHQARSHQHCIREPHKTSKAGSRFLCLAECRQVYRYPSSGVISQTANLVLGHVQLIGPMHHIQQLSDNASDHSPHYAKCPATSAPPTQLTLPTSLSTSRSK